MKISACSDDASFAQWLEILLWLKTPVKLNLRGWDRFFL